MWLRRLFGFSVLYSSSGLVWFMTVSRRIQDKAARADARLYLHIIYF